MQVSDNAQHQPPRTANWIGSVFRKLGSRKRNAMDRQLRSVARERARVLSGDTLMEWDGEASLQGLHIWSV